MYKIRYSDFDDVMAFQPLREFRDMRTFFSILGLVAGVSLVTSAFAADPVLQPGMFLQLGFGGSDHRMSALHYGFQLNYNQQFVRDMVLRGQPDASRMRPDEVQTLLDQHQVPAVLSWDFGVRRSGALMVNGVDLMQTRAGLYDNDSSAGNLFTDPNFLIGTAVILSGAIVGAIVIHSHGGGPSNGASSGNNSCSGNGSSSGNGGSGNGGC
ncbi:MAG: hypothetical protein ACRETW_05285 [Stenotrophobium sp.]